ncbi:MAG: hypothetical protein ACE5HC_02455 [Candidatus Binatia bacterium]
MQKAKRLGRFIFSIQGSHRAATLLREEYDSLPTTNESPHLIIEVRDVVPSQESGRIYLRDSLYSQGKTFSGVEKRSGYTFTVSGDIAAEYPLRVVISCHSWAVANNGPQALAHWIDKRRNWSFLSRTERLAKNVLYDFIHPIFHLSMLRLGQGFCHASAITDTSRGAILFTGCGGSGKTSAGFCFMEEGHWLYLSDDILLTDEEAQAYAYPMHMQVYGYNTIRSPKLLNRVLRGRSLDDISQWKLRSWMHGPHKVRRRISPARLFGAERIGTKSKIRQVFYLRRTDTHNLKVETMAVEDVARRSAHIILDEYRKFLEKLNLCALEISNLDTTQLFDKNKSFYEKSFSEAACFKVDVPRHFSPLELYDGLKSHVGNT